MFSKPQQTVARITSSEPSENRSASAPSNDRMMLDRVINAIAAHSRFVTTSLNTKKAITVVATISKLPINDAFEEEPQLIPSIKRIGAAMSRTTMPIT